MAVELRVRAERKTGQILQVSDKAKRGPDKGTRQRSQRTTSETQDLASLGITKDQSSKWQKLADVPELDSTGKPASKQGQICL